MSKSLSLFLLALVFLASCKTPNIVVSESLKTNTNVYDASGRQGFQFNQVVRFGDYYTSKIKRGWTKSRDITFVMRFQKAQQKLSFMQFAPDSSSAEVLAVSKFKNNEIELLRDFLSYSTQYENTFAGTIITSGDSSQSWEFMIHNPESSLPRYADCGVANSADGKVISIRGVKKIENQSNWIQLDNHGFEFTMDGKAVAAVSTINKGRVWLHNELSSSDKLVIASLSTALLVRHSIQEQFEE